MHANATLPPLPLAQRMTPTQRVLSIFFSHFFGHVFERIFHDFWLPSGGPKSPKIVPGAEKVRSETVSDAIFVGFWCRCRSESLSGPILTRFFTEIRA